MAKPKLYEVYDANTGELLTEGTAAYCSKVLHVGGDTVRAIARGAIKSTRFEVVCVSEGEEKGADACAAMKAAANAWDAFVEPIRKKYGIPVYQPGKEAGIHGA